MNTFIAKYLAPLTLAEWGAIMLYFSLSGRLAAFLHPMFRPMVLVAGVLLLATALILLLSGGAGCGHGEGEACDHGEEGHTHSHEHSAFRNIFSFLILLLPIALAAGYSPNSYGASMVHNRGVIASGASLPKLKVVIPLTVTPAAPGSTPATAAANSAAAAGGTPDQSTATLAPGEPPLPTADGKPDPSAAATPSGEFQNPTLKRNARGNIEADVLDLMYASEEASMMKDFEGKKVELIGQVVHRQEAEHEKGPFQLVRFLMSCCAADARPVAVMIEYPKSETDFKSMSWVKVTGKVQFKKAGSTVYPDVTAESVKPESEPADIYLY